MPVTRAERRREGAKAMASRAAGGGEERSGRERMPTKLTQQSDWDCCVCGSAGAGSFPRAPASWLWRAMGAEAASIEPTFAAMDS